MKGYPIKQKEKLLAKIVALRTAGKTLRETARALGVGNNTVIRLLMDPVALDREKKTFSDRKRAKRLWELYRLTEADYEKILAHQKGVCAVSQKPPKTMRLNVDHRHDTGEIFGLLSPSINKGLGYFQDSPELLRAAAEYLENPPARTALGRRAYGLIGRAKMGKKNPVYGPPTKVTKRL